VKASTLMSATGAHARLESLLPAGDSGTAAALSLVMSLSMIRPSAV
jgi:hypothetical protein